MNNLKPQTHTHTHIYIYMLLYNNGSFAITFTELLLTKKKNYKANSYYLFLQFLLCLTFHLLQPLYF